MVAASSLFLGAVATLAAVASADNWVVIAAGSSGYGNYRHQSDACHAYQIVKKHGIPESNIILMVRNVGNRQPGRSFNSF